MGVEMRLVGPSMSRSGDRRGQKHGDKRCCASQVLSLRCPKAPLGGSHCRRRHVAGLSWEGPTLIGIGSKPRSPLRGQPVTRLVHPRA